MKTKTILITLLAILAVTAIIFQSCKKAETNTKPPIYTNGEGTVGEIGGTVKIDDESSPINGASIVIPEGALSNDVTIKIEQPDSNYYVNGKQHHLIIDIQPSGIQFDKSVTIGIPYSSIENEEYFKPFYYNPESGDIEELNPVSLDKTNKICYAETSHTSLYFDDEMEMQIHRVKINKNGTTKIAAYAQIIVDFEDLPTGWAYQLDGYPNAYSILYSPYVPGVTSNYVARLYKKELITPELVSTKEMEVWINGCGQNDDYGDVVIDKVVNNSHTTIFTADNISKADIAGEYMSGYPLLFIFDDFTPNESDEYFVKVSWGEEKDWRTFTDRYTLGKKKDAEKLSDMAWTTGDANLNGILDNYEGGGGNQPPYAPNNESPDNGATDVSVNTNLSWTCSDPDGDELDYDIYFGTSQNPPKVEQNYTSTTYNPGTLQENTTYYWEIRAFEVDNNDHSSHSSWSFTTGGSGGGNPPDVNLQTPTGVQSGNVTITYTVTDEDGNNNDFTIYYQSPSTGSNPATIVSTDAGTIDGSIIKNVPPGTHSFAWNSNQDYPNNHTSSMKMKMVWDATLGFETNTFEVDNTGGGTTGTFTDPRDGQTYQTVEIGTQTWMAENLNYQTTNSWCYDDDPANCNIYGRLYNWEAAFNACPSGWHLPSDEEWKQMEMALGMSQSEADDTGWRGTDEGEKMKSTSGWNNNGNGTNSSGFSALPGGYRNSSDSFDGLGNFGYWWSSSEISGTHAWTRGLRDGDDQVGREYGRKTHSFDVRCIKD